MSLGKVIDLLHKGRRRLADPTVALNGFHQDNRCFFSRQVGFKWPHELTEETVNEMFFAFVGLAFPRRREGDLNNARQQRRYTGLRASLDMKRIYRILNGEE